MAKIEIKNLHVEVDSKEILKGINLIIEDGDVLALFGPNGNGKSTLLMTIMGHPRYHVTRGAIIFDGIDITNMTTDQRAKLGIFLSMQNPVEIAGITNSDFLKAAVNSSREKPLTTYQFYKLLDGAMKEAKIPFEMATRGLNDGFSGGEKKRNEILQMLLLNPNFIMLDEIDSGLDVDAIQVVADCICEQKKQNKTILIISHYARLFDLVKPSKAAVIIDGKIVLEGDDKLIKKIDNEGYEFIKVEYGIDVDVSNKNMNQISLETCAVKDIAKKNE